MEKKVKELKQRLGGIKLQLDALEKEIEDNYATLNSLDIAVIKVCTVNLLFVAVLYNK